MLVGPNVEIISDSQSWSFELLWLAVALWNKYIFTVDIADKSNWLESRFLNMAEESLPALILTSRPLVLSSFYNSCYCMYVL